jgi:hypothetical protein
MDADTGDLYAYSPSKRAWEPLLNMGIYRIPSSGALAPPQRQYPRENHTHREVDVDGTLARVRTCHLQHPYLSGTYQYSYSYHLLIPSTHYLLPTIQYSYVILTI